MERESMKRERERAREREREPAREKREIEEIHRYKRENIER